MGIDLTIVPSRHDEILTGWFLAYDRLSVTRDYDLFDRVRAIKARPFPDDFHFDWYDDSGVERKKEDPYGDGLKYVKSIELANAFSNGELSVRNKALASFLSALPPETWVILWWH